VAVTQLIIIHFPMEMEMLIILKDWHLRTWRSQFSNKEDDVC